MDKRWKKHVFAALIAALTVLFAATTTASAASAVCGKLERQLQRAGKLQHGSGASAHKARRQRAELAKATEGARRYRCWLDQAMPPCPLFLSTIARMKVNLVRLDGGAASRRPANAASLRAALRANGCTQTARLIARDGRRTAADRPRSQASADSGGAYRTLCVRSCDGYFFPISYATTEAHFARDEAICKAQCPSMEVGLYAHRTADEDVETMVSTRDRKPYTDLKAAFLYKLSGPKQPGERCGCAFRATVRIAAATSAASWSARHAAPVPVPAEPFRQEARLAEMALDLRATASTLSIPLAKPEIVVVDRSERRVRVVGPSFYPDR